MLFCTFKLTLVELLAFHTSWISVSKLREVSVSWVIRLSRMMGHFRKLGLLFG